MLTTRFAPSPTGRIHLGHAYSAVIGHNRARSTGGRFLLRIEDLDQTRSLLSSRNAVTLTPKRWSG